MNLNKKILLFAIVIIGLVVPFVPVLVIIEMFFLLIPFSIIFIVTLIYLTVSLRNKKLNSRKAAFVVSLLPAFIFSQLLSGFVVDKIQKFRCQKLIAETEEYKTKSGELPEDIQIPFGIEYVRMNDKESFAISYSRGFMVTEQYESNDKHWRSHGGDD